MVKKIPHKDLIEDAKKYNSRGEWCKNSPSKYGIARKRGISDECTKHMIRLANPYTDDIGVVYAFVFNDSSVYVGLTVNERKRFLAHINERGPVFNKIRQGFTYEYKILEDKISNVALADRECFYIEEYKKDANFTLLNKQKGGSRGGLSRLTSFEDIAASARKYDTKASWYKAEPNFYHTAIKRKILDKVCSHMTDGIKRWTDDEIIADAAKYNTKVEWLKNSKSAYSLAGLRKIRHICCKHMKVLQRNWTDDELYEESLKYNSKTEWKQNSPASFGAASKRKILDRCSTHMDDRFRWTEELLLIDALKYTTKQEWYKNSSGAFCAAKRLKLMNKCSAHMMKYCKSTRTFIQPSTLADEDDVMIQS
jgi:predicted GIY-YIG superfamily endonuclease